MVDFSARIRMLPREDSRWRPAAGWAWYCSPRPGQDFHRASLISRNGFYLPERTNVVYATLLDADARPLFAPGTVFDIVDGDLVATGVVEPPDRLDFYEERPRDQTHPVLQGWVRRRPEWFTRTRLELNEHSAGWSALIEDAFSTINEVAPDRATDIRVAQVKQKLGGLVIYVRHQLPADVSAIIEDKLYEVHRRSLTICELCGSAGQRGSQSGFICVRCPDCAPRIGHPISRGRFAQEYAYDPHSDARCSTHSSRRSRPKQAAFRLTEPVAPWSLAASGTTWILYRLHRRGR